MHASREDYQRFHERRHRALLAVLERHVPEKVRRCLDIGGGGDAGGLAGPIHDRFAEELHAIDLGEDVARGQSHGVETRECNIDHDPLPYEDAYFDLILFASVIEHLYNPRHALDEITRVLGPGGLLLVEAPNAVSLGRRLDALVGRNPFRWFNQHNAMEGKGFIVNCSIFYTAEEVEALVSPGYSIVERGYAMHNPRQNQIKRVIREVAARLDPGLSDCFYVLARKR